LLSCRAFLAIVLTAGNWSAAAFAQDARPLSGPEISTAISGNTIKAPTFAEYYDPDGSIRGLEGEEKYTGSWHVDGDKLCVDFPRHDFKDCVWVALGTDGEYSFMNGRQTNLRTIVAGNPDGL